MAQDFPLSSYVPRSVSSYLANNLSTQQNKADNDYDISNNHNQKWSLRPHHRSIGQGAVFLLDLVGYTKFASTAKGGADEVATVINKLFSQMISIIHSYQGCEIIKFCGDALLCLCSNHSTIESALQTAASCALAVQNEIFYANKSELEILQQNITKPILQLHVGIATGEFIELFAGGVNGRFEHMITGTPLQYLEEAIDTAIAGQVVIHKSSLNIIQQLQQQNLIQGKFCLNGGFLVTNITDINQNKQKLMKNQTDHRTLPQEAKDKSQNDKLNRVLSGFTPLVDFVPGSAEFRQCSILFAQLPDFDACSEHEDCRTQAFNETQKIVEELQFALIDNGGYIRQLLRDDKGTVAIAIFGLPTRSHEDDAARAIKTGVMLTNRTSCKAVGIATGDVFVGLVGSKERCEYAAVGDAVNTAARIMCACNKVGKPLLVCDKSQTLASRTSNNALQFDDKISIDMKGKGTQDIYAPSKVGRSITQENMSISFLNKSVYKSPNGTKPKVSLNKLNGSNSKIKSPPFENDDDNNNNNSNSASAQSNCDDNDYLCNKNGNLPARVHDKEFRLIHQSMPNSAICLIGDAGSGKSTLAASFAEQAVDTNLVSGVIYTAADSTETETPFFAFKFVVDDAVNRYGGGNCTNLLQVCGLDTRLAPLLNPLVEIKIESNNFCDRMNNKVQREQSTQLVSKIINYVATQQDISHNGDNHKNGNLKQNKLLVIEDLHWMDDLSCRVVKKLASSNCSILATTRTLPTILCETAIFQQIIVNPLTELEAKSIAAPFIPPLTEDTAMMLYNKSDGNAFFLTELLRAAVHTDSVNSIPNTVRGVLVSRIDKLPPGCIAFLKSASVFGRTFHLETVSTILMSGTTMDKIYEYAEFAIESKLIEKVDEINNQGISFRRSSLTTTTIRTALDVFRFVHALGAEAVYSLIPHGELANLHDKAAELVTTAELAEYHRLKAVDASPNQARLESAVRALVDGTRDRMALCAMDLERARERWKKARSLLSQIDNNDVFKQDMDIQMTLDEGRHVFVWVGFGSDEAAVVVQKALNLIKQRGKKDDNDDEIMALSGLWAHSMTGMVSRKSGAQALHYAQELQALALDPSYVTDPESLPWTTREIYHVVWTEYARRGQLRDMMKFLKPVLGSLADHGGKPVIGHNAETCATVFGCKAVWLFGKFDDAIKIAQSGVGIVDEPFSNAHSRVWGVATTMAWNGECHDSIMHELEHESFANQSHFHNPIRQILLLYLSIRSGTVQYGTIHGIVTKQAFILPLGEFPFTVSYALIQRAYELKLDLLNTPRVPELCEALRLVLAYWKEIRDCSDGWGPGLFQWVSGMLLILESPIDNQDMILSLFDTGSAIAKQEGANGVLLLIETSRVKYLHTYNNRLQQYDIKMLSKSIETLSRIRNKCTGDSNKVAALIFADQVLEQSLQYLVRLEKQESFVGPVTVFATIVAAFAAGGILLLHRCGKNSFFRK